MSSNDTSGRGAIGAQQQGNITHGVMPEQVVKELQAATTAYPGSEFLVIQRTRQSDEPRIWSTGDPEQTKALFRQVSNAFQTERESAT